MNCGPDCPAFLRKWTSWWRVKAAEGPLAILECGPDYMDRVGGKSRNMVRKAERLYEYRHFVYNDYLAEIKSVNSSKRARQGRAMTGWYTRDPEPVRRSY